MKTIFKGEEFYCDDNKIVEIIDNYDGLNPEQQIEVDLFRANIQGENHQNSPKKQNKIPQSLVDNITEKYSHSELINFLLNAQRVKGELRQRLFNNYLKNISKQAVGEKYLNEVFFAK